MVYTNTLTAAQKDKKIPIIIKRDGNVCFFCKQEFVEQISGLQRFIDHANDNGKDGRIENLLLAHRSCNEKKKNNLDWKILAQEKLEENLHRVESLSEREKKEDTHGDELTEGAINLIINKLVQAELESKLPKNSQKTLSYSKTMKSITYLVIQQTGGRGSETAVRRSLDAHCSEIALWGDRKEGRGNRIIFRRMNE